MTESSGGAVASAAPFADFAPPLSPQTALRRAVTAAARRPETVCVPPLIEAAILEPERSARADAMARTLVAAMRAKHRGSGMEGLVREYSLSSQEGVALMCLAEALLRIPDVATRDALIRDKVATGDWRSHLGEGRPLFVNAATWGLVVTGRITTTLGDAALSSTLSRVVARCGEPLVRKGVNLAFQMMGERFVTGQTIEAALAKSRRMEARGFGYSYDMLGEAAKTAADADRYDAAYAGAIAAIGAASARRGVHRGPGISIKLSALHPRYARACVERVAAELIPRVKALALEAKHHDIGFNIDAEEADRLEMSLDILETLALDPDLAGWDGLGFVVQAYGKRCPAVIDVIVDLARRSGHRIMVRLVKGAYWDAEIKRAQVDGLAGFPVFTRKIHTDVSYVACARKLLDARAQVFPQFATHNARTLATILAMAGDDFSFGDYEFQCLHGMGEPLYEEVVGAARLGRPCRIYAPVGTHETLLAYLVRRLLENGANSSFVNRIADPDVSIDALVEDPVEAARAIAPLGAPHPAITLPRDLFGARVNSEGVDFADETALAALTLAMRNACATEWTAAPSSAGSGHSVAPRAVLNPADRSDVVGHVRDATAAGVAVAASKATAIAGRWAATPVAERAACLLRAADLMQAAMPTLLCLIVREGGRTVPNAAAEVREAIDFLRYYADQAVSALSGLSPLGPVACISPWNFPLAIFTGQVAAALVAGNPVLAKPAEETPLVAMAAVAILHGAGVPGDVLRILPGGGGIGAALVADPAIRGVMFTGSSEVAKAIQRVLAEGRRPGVGVVPLIAETGGQNAMIVDSSALAEQVVGDVILSAFDSAGQRCSALRVLCLQEEIADRTLEMLRGAMAELSIGRPDRLRTDVGPVISAKAAATIAAHVDAMRAAGRRVDRLDLPEACRSGSFVAPTIVSIDSISDLRREVFGPVLHVLRYRREGLDALVDSINATGYGLTFGLHTRLDETVARVRARIGAGNVYINRNMVGAVVGSQPFGGCGLSGTGPKAGGPLYLLRLVEGRAATRAAGPGGGRPDVLRAFTGWLAAGGYADEAETGRRYARDTRIGQELALPGPVGERNLHALRPRGTLLLVPQTARGLLLQIGAALATGNDVVVDPTSGVDTILHGLPDGVRDRIIIVDTGWATGGPFAAALVEGDPARVGEVCRRLAALEGPIISVFAASASDLASGAGGYRLEPLLQEVTTSIDTTAAGGNASLMAMA